MDPDDRTVRRVAMEMIEREMVGAHEELERATINLEVCLDRVRECKLRLSRLQDMFIEGGLAIAKELEGDGNDDG
jgi:hypothetical protein